MKKRLKKKHELKNKLAQLTAENTLLIEVLKRHKVAIDFLTTQNEQRLKRLEDLEKRYAINVQATNSRLEALESEVRQLRLDLDKARLESKAPKRKKWFG